MTVRVRVSLVHTKMLTAITATTGVEHCHVHVIFYFRRRAGLLMSITVFPRVEFEETNSEFLYVLLGALIVSLTRFNRTCDVTPNCDIAGVVHGASFCAILRHGQHRANFKPTFGIRAILIVNINMLERLIDTTLHIIFATAMTCQQST
jgi:hypothetical protein